MVETTRDCSLREMVAAMSDLSDDATFRWHQLSHVGPGGTPQADEVLRVTVGQARRELGVAP